MTISQEMPPGSDLPQSSGWHRAHLRPERQRLGAGVQHDAGDEVVTGPGGQVPEAAEVVRADGGRSLDFDADDLTPAVLQDRVDLHLVLGAVVEQLGTLPRPGELAGPFHQDEPREPWAEPAAGPQQAPDVRAEQVGGDPRVGKGQLGRADGARAY